MIISSLSMIYFLVTPEYFEIVERTEKMLGGPHKLTSSLVGSISHKASCQRIIDPRTRERQGDKLLEYFY